MSSDQVCFATNLPNPNSKPRVMSNQAIPTRNALRRDGRGQRWSSVRKSTLKATTAVIPETWCAVCSSTRRA